MTGGITTTYTLDLNAGLTQVLADGTNTYLYGNGRIAQQGVTTTSYFLGDALGSVRQLANASGVVTLARSYQPFGSVLSSAGSGTSNYAFTGEWQDNTGLIHLRARYYAPGQGRFVSKDVWPGEYSRPMSFNAWLYAYANPVNYTDPSGLFAQEWDFRVHLEEAGLPSERDDRLDDFKMSHWGFSGIWDVLGREGNFVRWLQGSQRLTDGRAGNWYDRSDKYLTASRFAGERVAEYIQQGDGCADAYLGQLQPGVAEWAAVILVANGLSPTAVESLHFGPVGAQIRLWMSSALNVGFWRAHNAALREGVRQADALQLREREPQAERTLINFVLYNVLEPGDQCAAGSAGFCTFTISPALNFGTNHIYPQQYPATQDDIDKIVWWFGPIYFAWHVLGGRVPDPEIHLIR